MRTPRIHSTRGTSFKPHLGRIRPADVLSLLKAASNATIGDMKSGINEQDISPGDEFN